MKSKEQKRLEADYRAARASISDAQTRLDRLGDEHPELRRSLVQGIKSDRKVMTALDTTLRSKGYWYNGTSEVSANHR